jgi:hypothetical protein
MDEPVNIVFGNRLGNSLCSVNMNILVREIPARTLAGTSYYRGAHRLCGILAPDEIVHDVGVTDTFFNRLGVSEIIFLKIELRT